MAQMSFQQKCFGVSGPRTVTIFSGSWDVLHVAYSDSTVPLSFRSNQQPVVLAR